MALLDQGANVNAEGGEYGTAPQAASFKGHTEIVEMLLASGAIFDEQRGHYGNALQAASSKGNDKIAEVLLASGATVKAPSRCYRPDGDALQASSSGGHDTIVQMALEGQYTHGRRLGDYSNLFSRSELLHDTSASSAQLQRFDVPP